MLLCVKRSAFTPPLHLRLKLVTESLVDLLSNKLTGAKHVHAFEDSSGQTRLIALLESAAPAAVLLARSAVMLRRTEQFMQQIHPCRLFT